MTRNKLNFKPYIRLAMYHTWLPDYFIERRIFDYEFIFIDKGKMKIEFENEIKIVEEGDMVLIPPNVYHKISFYQVPCCQPHIHFDFNEDELSKQIPVSMKDIPEMSELELTYFRKDYLKENGYNLPYVVHSSDPTLVRSIILQLINEYTFDDPLKELHMEGAIKILISSFISDSIGYKEENENIDNVSLLVRFMTENLANNLTLRDFELKSNLSSWTLNNLFKKAFNTTPKKYYDNLRLRYAKDLIRNSFKSIKEISILLGFDEPQTFSRWFYNLDGRYPTQYKNEKNKNKLKKGY